MAGHAVSHGRDVTALDSCCKISQSLTPLEWVPRGRFVGNPEVICPGSGLVMGSRLVFTDEAALGNVFPGG
jgi:hypothetical protein